MSWWYSIPSSDKIFWPICCANVGVWMAWQNPEFSPSMYKYFTGGKLGVSLLLSTFSHRSFPHLVSNMTALRSLIPVALHIMGSEQKFVAMYLASGLASSLGSLHIHKICFGDWGASLGASGAVMGVMGLVYSRMPDLQVGIFLLPDFQFSAGTVLKCIIAIESAGVLLKWRVLDHAAHLSGCVFGILCNFLGQRCGVL